MKEPTGLLSENEKRSDGPSLNPWSNGKCLTWNVIMADTYTDSHLTATSSAVGSAANEAAIHKTPKYMSIAGTHHSMPVVIETSGVFGNEAEEFVQQVGHRCAEVTGDPKETSYLFQQISVAIQSGNAILYNNKFAEEF